MLWLQGMSCSGCSVSFLNSNDPGPADIITSMISLVYHSTISAAQGADAMRVIDQMIAGNDFILVLEGSVPTTMPEACMMGGRTLEVDSGAGAQQRQGDRGRRHLCRVWRHSRRRRKPDRRRRAERRSWSKKGIPFQNRLVNCPSCPVHPESVWGTLAYVVAKGYPEVNPKLLTPNMFYAHSVHDNALDSTIGKKNSSPSTSARKVVCSSWAASVR